MGTGRRSAILARQRGQVDYAAIATLFKKPTEDLAADESASQVDRGDRIELFSRDVEHWLGRRHRRIVDENFNRTPALDQGIARQSERTFLPYIKPQSHGRRTVGIDHVRGFHCPICIDVTNRDAVTSSMECHRNCETDTACTARHQCDVAVHAGITNSRPIRASTRM